MNHQVEFIRSVVLACCQAWSAAEQQQKDGRRPGSSRLKVFLDSHHARLAHQIRAEVDFVEYVDDGDRADVRVLVTSSPVKNGRREYSVAFTGFGRLEGIQILAHVGVAERRTSRTATTVNRGRPDTTDRDRRHALRERGAIIA
jgi:hypothetical protein